MHAHRAAVIAVVALAALLIGGAAAADPYFSSEFVFLTDSGYAHAHGPCVTRLANGDLLCVWQAQGSDEAIHYCRKAAGSSTWTAPAVVADDPTHNDVNPSVWQEPTGKVWCFYSTVTDGGVGFTSSQLKYTVSTNNGANWSAPVNMVAELGYLPRAHAFVASNGNWILPFYDERDWTSLMFISTNQGANWTMSSRISTGGGYQNGSIQPAVVERSDHVLRALMRKGPAPANIYESYSSDYGWTWSAPAAISLPNPSAAVDQVKLANGHVVLLFNNSGTERTPLTAALSTDEGATWSALRNLETTSAEYSYPSVIQTPDGLIHVVYRYRTNQIKHVVFNEEWLAASEPVAFRTITAAGQAAIVTDNTSWTVPEQKAADWLHDEILARTGMDLPVVDHTAFTPSAGVTAFLVGRHGHHALIDALRPSISLPAEGLHLEMTTSGGNPYVICAGADNRGTLYAVGNCLRKMTYASARLGVPALNTESSPQYPIRGHQLGYRARNNTIDKWDVPEFEQYIRDLLIFGTNAIELIPGRSPSNPPLGVHMPRTVWDMTQQLCTLCDQYDLRVWMWMPAAIDLNNSTDRASLLSDYTNVFAACGRIDAVLVPGGDDGANPPQLLVPFAQDVATALRTYHPSAEMWVSHQTWEVPDVAWFYNYLQTTAPTWLTGVVYGPNTRDTVAHSRAMIPVQYPLRRYPDITHCVRSELPMPNWDHAFALTEGREPINPRPVAEAAICNLYKDYAVGSITYSDGVNDDLNKLIWSARMWDPNATVWTILEDYNSYFLGNEFGEGMVSDLLNLESNWVGKVTTNTSIDSTLADWQGVEAVASASTLANNWRFQQGLFRAYYDAYVKARRIEAASLEQSAYTQLNQAGSVGATTAINNALNTLTLQDGSGVGGSYKSRVQQLGDDLFNSIGMQMSMSAPYNADGSERGAVLDFLDEYLNNRTWLQNELNAVKALGNETDRRAGITRIANWEYGGPTGYFEDLGNGAEGKEPHLIHAKTWDEDPGYVESAQDEFDWNKYLTGRLSWRRQGEALYDTLLQTHFDDLDTTAPYTLKVTYAGRFNTSVTLDADGTSIHGATAPTNPPTQMEFAIPAGVTSDGAVTLTWQRASYTAGRAAQVAEVWLERTNPSITINDGAVATTSPAFNLSLWARNPREMQFNYPGSGGWTAWEPFAFTKQITVTAPDGTVQVDFKVRYTDMSVSGTYSDTIILAATPLTAEAGSNKTIAPGDSTTLDGSASGGLAPYTYSWLPTTGLDNPNIAQPTASPSSTTTYTLTVHDSLGQIATDSATVTVSAPGTDDAAVVSASVPTSTLRNRAAGIQIAMRNTGTTTWTQAAGYALSSTNPDDNTTWGLNRVQLSPSDSIAPGQTKTFSFSITAPNSATYLSGPIHCDWQMIKDSTRFGAVSSNTLDVYTFYDVPTTATYWKHVEACYTAGLTAGCATDGQGRALYCPLSNCTRAMMAVFLVRAKGMTPLMSPTPHFGDVGSGLSYYGHVERLADAASWYDAGNPCLTTPTAGCAPGPLYCPNADCTRAMMAVFLCRACGKCPYTVGERPTPTFADVGTGLSYYGFVERLADAASWNNDPPTAGCAPNPLRFCPNDTATRAQMAVFLARAFQLAYH